MFYNLATYDSALRDSGAISAAIKPLANSDIVMKTMQTIEEYLSSYKDMMHVYEWSSPDYGRLIYNFNVSFEYALPLLY